MFGLLVSPPPTEGSRGAHALDERLHIYKANIDGEFQDVVSLLPEEVVFAQGLVPQAIIGKLRKRSDEGGKLTPDNFVENGAFVKFLHELIGRYAPEIPALRAEAKQLDTGRVYVIDGRTPTPQGDVPAFDIVGAFRVEAGVVVSDSYERNPNHRIFSQNGFFRLDLVLDRQLSAELTRLTTPQL